MPSIGSPLFWTLFLVGVAAILVLDLGVLNRKAHAVRPREAALWTVFCVSLATLFALWLGWRFGSVRSTSARATGTARSSAATTATWRPPCGSACGW